MENKTIVITGAASGAGKATALELVPERVNLVLADRFAGVGLLAVRLLGGKKKLV